MEKMLLAALFLTAGYASAQVRARDQLKASAPSGTEIAVPAAPSAKPAGKSAEADGNNTLSLSGIPGETVLDKVKTLFDKGVPATKKDLIGWHSGREVRDNRPDLLYGSVLLAGEFTDETGRKTFRVMSHPNWTKDYFDDLDAAKKSFLRQKWDAVAPTAHEVVFPSAVVTSKVMAFREARGCIISAYGRAGEAPYTYAFYCKDVTPSADK
ncbi:MAG: hypothetical protein PHS14_03980 [Elusimicrobia bacterium]|nr:hypothetical protein [Elusimicrobiota bacterium]